MTLKTAGGKVLKAMLIILLALSPLRAFCQNEKYLNPDLSRSERVEDLLGRLTIEEKFGLMMNSSKGVERLGIPDYDWWNEALHGVARAGLATVYPQAIALAATFDPENQYQAFSYISDEARAKYYEAVRRGERKRYMGLTFWTPNINIFRDPRWGRGQETYGEDPYLTSVMADATVRGLQGNDPNYYKTHACAKHFAVHSGPEWNRHSFDVEVTPRDLWETYLPAFRTLVTESGVREVMGAYNSYSGDPCCANDFLLNGILRGRWGYDGIVVSDCGAIKDFYLKGHHETHPNAASASADAVKKGTDIECGNSYLALLDAFQEGLISEDEIDVSIRRILNGFFELGIFDPAERVPWSGMPYSKVDCEEHRSHALKMARESIVLLKNEGVLPLKASDTRKICVVGPNATDETMMLGNYNGTPSSITSILEGIEQAFPDAEISYMKGCEAVSPLLEADSLARLSSKASQSEVIIFVGGLNPRLEGEEMKVSVDGFRGGDRERIELPEVQSQVLKALHSTGRKVVFVLCSGSAVALERNEKDYDALLCAWYGGQAGGQAVGEVLCGKVSPSGKLPVTFYKSSSQLPDFQNYDMEGRTYRYFRGEPLYAFGEGLSYADIRYGRAKASRRSIKAGESVSVSVPLENRSGIGSDEVVQLYVRRLDDPEAPIKSLKAFQRVSLAGGEKKTVKLVLGPEAFSYYDAAEDDLKVKSGRYELLYGCSSKDSDLQKIELTVK